MKILKQLRGSLRLQHRGRIEIRPLSGVRFGHALRSQTPGHKTNAQCHMILSFNENSAPWLIPVTPAEAGVQKTESAMDSGLRRNYRGMVIQRFLNF
jgi:hypothetical protein